MGVDSETLLNTLAVAKLLHVSESSFKMMRWHGTGPNFIKRGNRVYYRPIDILVWLAELNLIGRQRRGRPPNKAAPVANTFAPHA
jgi:hypothetical protein